MRLFLPIFRNDHCLSLAFLGGPLAIHIPNVFDIFLSFKMERLKAEDKQGLNLSLFIHYHFSLQKNQLPCN